MLIFKILTDEEWRSFQAHGQFTGASVDLADGYIHFSSADQVEETARKHFAHLSDLILVAVDPAQLGAALRYEPSRGGALFPHLYTSLTLAHVAWSKVLPLRTDGTHDFAGLLA